MNNRGPQILISAADKQKLTELLDLKKRLTAPPNRGALIALLSAAFVGTPYQAGTLIGSPERAEVVTVNFSALDCFTFLDYVLALSSSETQADFIRALIKIRYVNGTVNFLSRKHFFSDWYRRLPKNAVDITARLSKRSVKITKTLNQKANGREYIPGLEKRRRLITYIPGSALNDLVPSQLANGDFIGIYTPLCGLDVTHVGILIRQGEELILRHASSLPAISKVVDTDWRTYCQQKPGIIIVRAPD